MTKVVVVTPEELRALIREEVEGAIAELCDEAREPEGLLTESQLAKRLKCSARTLYVYRQRGMPCVLLGESPRYDLPEVLRWLKGKRLAE